MIAFTPEAGQQVRDLRWYYENRERSDAIQGLTNAVEAAWRKITANPTIGLAAPRPYPEIARAGRLWIKSGRNWMAYSPSNPPVIVGVFYETADIPRRV